MSTITLHNESENQLKLIETLLKELNIKFEVSKKEKILKLTDFEKKLIQEGLDDVKSGNVISSEEALKRAKECFKQSGQKKLQSNELIFWNFGLSTINLKRIQQKILKETLEAEKLLKENPSIGTITDLDEVRRILILRNFSRFYSIENKIINILAFYDNRRNPDKLEL